MTTVGKTTAKFVDDKFQQTIGAQLAADKEVLDYLDWQSQVDSMFISSHPSNKERRTVSRLGEEGGYTKSEKNLEEEDYMAARSVVFRAKKKNDELREASRKADADDLYNKMRLIERGKKKKKQEEDLSMEQADKLSKFF